MAAREGWSLLGRGLVSFPLLLPIIKGVLGVVLTKLDLGVAINALNGDSKLLGGPEGNVGFMKFAETDDVHEKGNTSALERASKRVFIVAQVWGSNSSTKAPVTAGATCLQANQKMEPVAPGGSGSNGNGNGTGAGAGDGGKSVAVSVQVGSLLGLVSMMAVAFGLV
jgi:hypothetical protein